MTQDSQLKRPWYAEVTDMLPGALLALLMLWAVVRSIAIAGWASGLEVLVSVTLPAVMLGVLFAGLRWLPIWLAHLLSAALGVVWAVHRLGSLMGERLTTWPDQATELLIRVIMLVRVLLGGGRGEDILLFVAAMSLLGWALGYGSAWMIFRRGWVWRTVLLNAFIILTNYTYVLPKPTGLFFVFLTAALLLVVYQHVLQRQERWAAEQIEYPDFLPVRVVAAAALVCGTLILITSLLPGDVTLTQATQTWNALKQPFILARERWEDAFSTINAPPGTSGNSFASRTSQLGGARALGDSTVMYVTSPKYDYWRAVAFDRYINGGWQNTTGEQARATLDASSPEQARTPIDAGTPILRNAVRGRAVVTQTVRLGADRKDNLITVGGEALRLSLPALVEHSYVIDPQGQRRPNFDDTALIAAREPLRATQIYTITALASVADVQSLRAAGTEYPTWVRERYGQLPDSITPRTAALAREIAQKADAGTPYDQAMAIQNYLRTLPYNEQINAPPSGTDPVDYFLFDVRQGYCDYYASSMVVMLRSLGVPARWVQGYAGGILDPELGVYVVRENLAHSWPEVYFPGFGWERFEPTPASYTTVPLRPATPFQGEDAGDLSGPNLEFRVPNDPDLAQELDPGLEMDSSAGSLGDAPLAPPANPNPWRQRLALLGLVFGVAGLAAVGLLIFWRRELRGLSPAAAAYAQLNLLAGWAGLPQRPHSTPREYGDALAEALPNERAALERIVSAYVTERYHKRAEPGDDQRLGHDLQQLRRSLLRYAARRLGVKLRLVGTPLTGNWRQQGRE